MILDIDAFIQRERPIWEAFERELEAMIQNPMLELPLPHIEKLHYLYERVSADLAELTTFAPEGETQHYLQALVARGYAEIHEARPRTRAFRLRTWLRSGLPRTVRRRHRALSMSCAITMLGALCGGFILALNPTARETLLPYPHLIISPQERVAQEEARAMEETPYAGLKASGSASYFTHNTKVSYMTLGLGIFAGLGSILMLLLNGTLLGAVVVDYALAGQGLFVTAWLLPHGSVEIPAILLAGQGGLTLGGAVIGWGSNHTLGQRMRSCAPDIASLAGGIALLLVWAGIIEACFSQYHEPILPYWIKATFGAIQLALLIAYLTFSGRKDSSS
jgi:uncharacterized membrane protein SpoIIM required for sporulation